MLSYLLGRFAQGVLVLIGVVVVVSALLFSAPVDPAQLTFGQRVDEESIIAKQQALGLDQPVARRIITYLGDLLPWSYRDGSTEYVGCDMGTSYQSGEQVIVLLSQAIPNTIMLAVSAFLFAMVVGVLLGMLAASWRGSRADKMIILVSTLGISVPSYVSSIVLALVFGYALHHLTGLPIQGSIDALDDMGDPYTAWSHLILPALALGVRPVAVITQLTRSAVIDVITADYVRTAKAKGVSSKSILMDHVLPNAANPIITTATGWLASLLAGTFFVERVFSFRGVGDLTISALVNYDIPVVLGCILFVCLVFVVVNIVADILYVVTDPKSRLG